MAITIEKDELDQQPDYFQVQNKRPGYVYRLLNINSRNLGMKQYQGYELVKDKDPEKLIMNDSTPLKRGESLDSTQRFADTVLARIPVEKHKKIAKRNRALIERQTRMIVQDYDRDTGKYGFNPRRDPTGHATRYSAGVTESSFDKEHLSDQEFESKYGMTKDKAGD